VKKAVFILMHIFLLPCYTGNAQKFFTIRGTVCDSLTLEPVANVEVVISGYTDKTYTNEDGFFTLIAPAKNCEVEFHGISYNSKKMVLSSDLPVRLYLSQRTYNLSSVEIAANRPKDLMPGISYQIMDYEFFGENIILLAYEKQSFLLPKLLLINKEGDTLCAVEVQKPLKLCRDFDNNVYFMSKTTSFEVNVENNRIILSNPVNNAEYEEINNSIVGHDGNNYYLRQYLYNNQILNYYNYDECNDELYCFRTITDIEAIQRNRWGAYFDGKEEDIRFQQLIMNRALNAPLIQFQDTILLFNFLQSKLEKYSLKADTISEVAIDFHKSKSFSDDLYIDRLKSKVYMLFRKNGISQIKEISTGNGSVVQTIDIPGFVYIEKIKINDGIIYFLYKSKDLLEYKKLYSMKI